MTSVAKVGVFNTTNLTNDVPGLRITSVALAGLFTLILFVYVLYKIKRSIDTQRPVQDGMAIMLMLFVAITTFLSWFVASLNVDSTYLVTIMVFELLTAFSMLIGFYSIFSNDVDQASRQFGCSALFCTINQVLLMLSESDAGREGNVTQSTLNIPVLLLSLTMAIGTAFVASSRQKTPTRTQTSLYQR
jgi:magnesium-transporting ATPase (P-type)